MEAAFGPKLNAIWGNNAQGKTNLLEAILLVSTGRSFRTQHLSELIREGQNSFFLEAEMVKDGVSHRVRVSFDGKQKKLQIDGNTFSHFQPLLGMLPAVISAPEDAELITGSPTLRRRFLNFHLAQSDPLYMHHLARFWRAMKQRNFLLRARNNEGISCWEFEMAQSAHYLSCARREFIEQIQSPLASQSRRLSHEEEMVGLRFHPSHSSDCASYIQQMEKNREREQKLGMTLIGPHRDDLSFWIGSKQAKIFASEGQKKTSIAALRLAEWERLRQKIDSPPLFAIDDFAWPLDASRQALLVAHLQILGQVFLTAPFPPPTFDQGVTLLVQNGTCSIS